MTPDAAVGEFYFEVFQKLSDAQLRELERDYAARAKTDKLLQA